VTDPTVDPPAADEPPARRRHWSLRRWSTLVAVLAAAVSVAAIGGGGASIVRLQTARDTVVGRVDPAIRATQSLLTALLDEETGVRGFALSADADFLTPYETGRLDEIAAAARIRSALGGRYPALDADLDAVLHRVDVWRTDYAEPTIAAVRVSGVATSTTDVDLGKKLFDAIRADLDTTLTDLDATRREAAAQLQRNADALTRTALAIGAALLIGSAALAVGLARGVTGPLTDLGNRIRRVAAGDFDHEVRGGGPTEIRRVGADVDSMRRRILVELAASRDVNAALEERTRELERSNSELEQFAYVASHDLQEPLRKVASFCELIETRYDDQLDERGRQYIAFAVDGATRMQALINDLLAFSRVGRLSSDHAPVDMNRTFASAVADLGPAIADGGATVTAGPLPTVTGDAVLLAAVLANLIGNAVKFRRPEVPARVAITARADGDKWEFTCDDNGIGIDAEYAERIFVIFQRLHPKTAYPGTGIGLAMCRKIIEFHGGRIWLDVSDGDGSRFRFTLPRTEPAGEPT
jgi:signal transduction histidine kinase